MKKKQRLYLVWTPLFIGLLILTASFTPNGLAAQSNIPLKDLNDVGGVLCNLVKSASNPVLSPGIGNAWDSTGIWDPAVVNAGGNYKMYYSGSDGVNPPRIGLATSLNGTTWTKFGSTPIAGALSNCDANGARTGTVLNVGGEYRMWYQGRGTDNVWRICYASSPDGLTWTGKTDAILDRGLGNSWDSAWVRYPTVVLDGSVYHMWFTGSDWTTNQIGHATSLDGLNWTKEPDPVIEYGAIAAWDWMGVYAPSVVKVGSDFVMLDSGEALPPKWSIGSTRSADGVNWEGSVRVIPQGQSGAFDEYSADFPMILLEGSKYRIWYSGISSSDVYTIGYAEADACTGSPPAGPLSYLPLVHRGQSLGYIDDFSDTQSGWYSTSDSDWQIGYLDGEYQEWLKNPGWWAWATSGAKAETYVAEVKAHRTSGTYGAYGFVFLIDQNRQFDFYMALVEDTSFVIYHYVDPNWLVVQNWTYSASINPGTGWNDLKLVMPPNGQPQVYCNNTLLWSALTPTLGEGIQVGLVTVAPSDSGLDVRFDNIMMYPYGGTRGNSFASSPFNPINSLSKELIFTKAGEGVVAPGGIFQNGPALTR